MFRFIRTLCAVAISCVLATSVYAGETRVAVAANFAITAKEIGRLFHTETSHTVTFSLGSTGQIFTQIVNHAPFDVFLAADQDRPEKLINEGFAVADSRRTYATGGLVLYSVDETLVDGDLTLSASGFRRLAIANPAVAPYGRAAYDVLDALSLLEQLKGRLVVGESIAQAYQFVATENAEVGFVALSQVVLNNAGSRWIVPQSLYDPIAQDLVLLNRAENNDAAMAFIDFLLSEKSAQIKKKYGYH